MEIDTEIRYTLMHFPGEELSTSDPNQRDPIISISHMFSINHPYSSVTAYNHW